MRPSTLTAFCICVVLVMTAGSEDTYVYEDLCLVDAVTTAWGKIPVGCNASCMEEGPKLLKNGTLCISMTREELRNMTPYTNYSCPLGLCDAGICVNCNSTWCYKHPVHTMAAPK
ncbi:evasin P546-like [Dermacentor silvarum]|uniref:evasin P546-like n=1 Tax=Dermacentor silvarum TaxID=543639 RepID=UPI002100C2D1|nr:evasin P546-like [Dermacentor silvarum]